MLQRWTAELGCRGDCFLIFRFICIISFVNFWICTLKCSVFNHIFRHVSSAQDNQKQTVIPANPDLTILAKLCALLSLAVEDQLNENPFFQRGTLWRHSPPPSPPIYFAGLKGVWQCFACQIRKEFVKINVFVSCLLHSSPPIGLPTDPSPAAPVVSPS